MSSRATDKFKLNQAPANISKSVARAFAVLELFRSRQTPMLAEMQQAGHYVGYDIYLQGVGVVCVSTAISRSPSRGPGTASAPTSRRFCASFGSTCDVLLTPDIGQVVVADQAGGA